jgi:hypothetical protein
MLIFLQQKIQHDPELAKKSGKRLAFERWRLTAARQPATMPSMNFSYPHPVLTWWRR